MRYLLVAAVIALADLTFLISRFFGRTFPRVAAVLAIAGGAVVVGLTYLIYIDPGDSPGSIVGLVFAGIAVLFGFIAAVGMIAGATRNHRFATGSLAGLTVAVLLAFAPYTRALPAFSICALLLGSVIGFVWHGVASRASRRFLARSSQNDA